MRPSLLNWACSKTARRMGSACTTGRMAVGTSVPGVTTTCMGWDCSNSTIAKVSNTKASSTKARFRAGGSLCTRTTKLTRGSGLMTRSMAKAFSRLLRRGSSKKQNLSRESHRDLASFTRAMECIRPGLRMGISNLKLRRVK